MTETMTVATLRTALTRARCRSAWTRGVRQYALDLVDHLEASDPAPVHVQDLLDGACDWQDYSRNGCSLIYNREIAARLCTPGELRRTRDGARQPNKRETWLDVQARALHQAARLVLSITKPA